MKYLHLSTYHLCWARDALLICRPIPDTGEGMLRRQSPSLDLELAPWWLTLPGGFAPHRHDTNPRTGLVCQSCHLPASHPVRESEGQMGRGGGERGWEEAPCTLLWGPGKERAYNEVYLFSTMSINVILFERCVHKGWQIVNSSNDLVTSTRSPVTCLALGLGFLLAPH